MARGPKNSRISFAGHTLTHFGGLVLFQRFVQRLGLRTLLGRRVWFPQRNNRYSVGESLLALLYPILLGLGRIETTQLLRRNGVFQYLTGLSAYPDPQTLRRFLVRFAQGGLDQLVRLHDDLRTTLIQEPERPSSVIFDLDSTVLTVYGRQGGAEVGFNPHKHGRPSYLPLLCVEGRSRDCWEASYHPGNTHVATVTLPLLECAFTKLPPDMHSVRARADSAFHDHRSSSGWKSTTPTMRSLRGSPSPCRPMWLAPATILGGTTSRSPSSPTLPWDGRVPAVLLRCGGLCPRNPPGS